MTLPRSAADVLSGHVAFEVECIDRMYLNVYVPQLQYATGLVSYIHRQLGMPVASTAALAPVSAAFTKAMRAFAADRQIPWVDFAKGQRKDDVAHEYLAGFTGTEGVLFIGRAQEKVPLFRTRKRRRADGSSYPWIAAETGVVNQFYCYCVDEDFGPFFLKFCSYFPFNAKLCINGNEWAKRQAAKAGIGFTPLDNAFAAVDDVPALQAICHGLGPVQIDALLRKWLARLPHPFSPADRAAGYRYDISILQAEFSLTQMLDKPVSGRIFFEQVIRDNLDLGRPDRISLIFGRSIYRGRKNHTPGTFATRVVTDGVTPSLHVLYKHTQIKQYHKQGRALRTETTINQTMDFGLGKRLTNLPALRQIGYTANRRLLAVQRLSHDPITGADVLHSACDPVIHGDGTRTAGLRLHRPPGPGAPAHPADLPAAPRRVPQQGPAHPARRIPRTPTSRPGIHHTRPGHLRPAPAARARPHRTHPPHPPLPGHRHRPAPRHVPHPHPRPRPAHRPRRTQRARPSRTTPSRPRLPGRHRRPHPPSRNPRLTGIPA